MEWWFCIKWTSCQEHPELDFVQLFIQVLIVKILVSAILGGVFDAMLEQAMTCGCVQEGCPHCVKNTCESLSLVQLAVQGAVGCVILFLGVVGLAGMLYQYGIEGSDDDGGPERGPHGPSGDHHDARVSEDHTTTTDGFNAAFFGYLLITVRELLVGKAIGVFGITFAVESLGFLAGRKGHMKPPKADAAARAKWDAKVVNCLGVESDAPSAMWNKYIGADVEPEDLEDWAPTYDLTVFACGRAVYRESAAAPSEIPKWFRDEAFLDDGDASARAALEREKAHGTAHPSVKRGAKSKRRILLRGGAAPGTQPSPPPGAAKAGKPSQVHPEGMASGGFFEAPTGPADLEGGAAT